MFWGAAQRRGLAPSVVGKANGIIKAARTSQAFSIELQAARLTIRSVRRKRRNRFVVNRTTR